MTTNPGDFEDALASMPSLVTYEMNRVLNNLPTQEEIHIVLFQMHPKHDSWH